MNIFLDYENSDRSIFNAPCAVRIRLKLNALAVHGHCLYRGLFELTSNSIACGRIFPKGKKEEKKQLDLYEPVPFILATLRVILLPLNRSIHLATRTTRAIRSKMAPVELQ